MRLTLNRLPPQPSLCQRHEAALPLRPPAPPSRSALPLRPPAPPSRSALPLHALLAALGVVLGLMVFPVAAATDNYYVAQTLPAGSNGSGLSAANAAVFNSTAQTHINNQLGAAGPADVTIWFLPGEYTISTFSMAIAGAVASGPGVTPVPSRKVRLKGYVGPGTDYPDSPRPVLKLASIHGHGSYAGSWGEKTAHHWLIRTATHANSNPDFPNENLEDYLDYFELTDLVLDGDFDNQGAFTGPGSVGGYKSFAVDVHARTGLIHNVLARRFGSSGALPWTYYAGAGTETFPVSVWTYGNDKDEETDWDIPNGRYPWVIENVEAADMRFQRGAYATLIMPHVRNLTNPTDLNAEPIIVVRHCQVRSDPGVIALGTAGSSTTINGVTTGYKSQRIRFEDNVVLNSKVALNTDTGAIGWLKMRRNAFLDISYGAFVGQWNTQANPANHHNYQFEDNFYRFRGRLNWRDYHEYDEPTVHPYVTDPNLALGRVYSDHVAALVFQGRASKISFQRNWLTTWPRGDFFFPSPGTKPAEEYRAIWVPAPNVKFDARVGNRNRYPSLEVTLQDCKTSGTAFEFAPGSAPLANPLANVTLASSSGIGSPYNGSYSHDYQRLRTSTDIPLPGSFQPRGKVERVAMDINSSNLKLESVREVVLGTGNTVELGTDGLGNPTIQVQVSAKLLKHVLPDTGGTTGTAPEANYRVRFGARLWTDGVELPLIDTYFPSYDTDANGLAGGTLVVQRSGGGELPVHGTLRLYAWFAPGSSTDAGVFDENASAWASLELPFGQVVTVDALPDVGDDKNTTAANKRAKFILRRSGSTSGALNVKLKLRDHKLDGGASDLRLVKPPGTGTSLIAAYGSTQDYYLSPGWPTGTLNLPYETTALSIPDGQPEVVFTVIPKADNLTENNVIILQALPDPNASSPAYTVGLRDRAEVLLYDGPEFTLYELTDSRWTPYGWESAQSSTATGLNNLANPMVSGWTGYSASPTATVGGYWLGSLTGSITDLWGAEGGAHSPLPYAISTSPVKLVGWQGASAFVTSTTIADYATLPALASVSGQSSTARGINPAATVIAGSSKNSSGYTRPVVWVAGGGSWGVYDIGWSGHYQWTGHAQSVNDAKQFGGQFHVEFYSSEGGSSGNFAFRTKPQGFPIDLNPATGEGDILHAIDTAGIMNRAGEVAWLNNSGGAVGWSENATPRRRATYWGTATQASSVVATDLGVWKPTIGSATHLYSAATAVNGSGWVVGWSGPVDSASDANAKAVLRRTTAADTQQARHWEDLNDKHFVHGSTGWVLKSAAAINDSNYIVGNGTLYGAPRAFLLIPRTPGN